MLDNIAGEGGRGTWNSAAEPVKQMGAKSW